MFLCTLLGTTRAVHFQDGLARLAGGLVDGKLHVAADHHAGQFLFGGVGNIHGTDAAALLQDGAAVGNRHDLIQLVGDEQDALALGLEAAHDLHQLVDLLRSQNRRRLVKNKDLVVAVEHFEDFDTLLHTDGDVADQRIRVDFQAVLLAELHDLFAGSVLLQETMAGILDTQNDIVKNGKTFDQLEMLVHHADAKRVGVVRVLDLDLFAIFLDNAFFRLIQTEQYAHQGRFTGTVFAQQRMDLAFAQLQRDIVVGLDTGELLCDVQHLDNEIICQSVHAPFYFHSILIYII